MNYKITLKCENTKDEEKFGRELNINSYESATATFKTLVTASIEHMIDPFVIEFYYGDLLRYKIESLKL